MSVRELVSRIAATPDCTVTAPLKRSDLHLPALHEGHVLPDDLREFYDICGGLILFERSPYPMMVVPPPEVVLANAVFFSALMPEEQIASLEDISWTWYLIARDEKRHYLTIDLSPAPVGRCYDSSPRHHAPPGSSTIVALSFTELLTRLYDIKSG